MIPEELEKEIERAKGEVRPRGAGRGGILCKYPDPIVLPPAPTCCPWPKYAAPCPYLLPLTPMHCPLPQCTAPGPSVLPPTPVHRPLPQCTVPCPPARCPLPHCAPPCNALPLPTPLPPIPLCCPHPAVLPLSPPLPPSPPCRPPGRRALLRQCHVRHHRPGRLRPAGQRGGRVPAPRPLAPRGRESLGGGGRGLPAAPIPWGAPGAPPAPTPCAPQAAWGGSALLSRTHRHLLAGIERYPRCETGSGLAA